MSARICSSLNDVKLGIIGENPDTTKAFESVIDCERYSSGVSPSTRDLAVS